MSVSLKFFTDAVPSVSFGGFYNKQWFADIWPKYLLSLPQKAQSTALLELYPVVVACLLWGMVWCRKCFLVVSDNEAIVNIINKGRISMTFINRFIRRLTCTSVMCNLAGAGVSLCLCVCVYSVHLSTTPPGILTQELAMQGQHRFETHRRARRRCFKWNILN